MNLTLEHTSGVTRRRDMNFTIPRPEGSSMGNDTNSQERKEERNNHAIPCAACSAYK